MDRSLYLFLRFVLIVIFLSSDFAFNQTQTKVDKLRRFAIQKKAESQRNKAIADSLAEKMGIPIRIEIEKGTLYELMKFHNGVPRYYKTHNIDAMVSTHVDKLRSSAGLGFDLIGDGYLKLGIWDGLDLERRGPCPHSPLLIQLSTPMPYFSSASPFSLG